MNLATDARPDRGRWLDRAFGLCSVARVAAYLPTIWALLHTGASSQHSLWTWGIWLLSNTTMACWLRGRVADRADPVVRVCAANAVMCAAIFGLIAWLR